MLVANGSVDSFWAGNLKQRNLDGSEWKRDETPEQSDSDYSGGDEEKLKRKEYTLKPMGNIPW